MKTLASVAIAAQLITTPILAQEQPCNGHPLAQYPIVIPQSPINPVGPLFIGYTGVKIDVAAKKICFNFHSNKALGLSFSKQHVCFDQAKESKDVPMFMTLVTKQKLVLPPVRREDAMEVLRRGTKFYNDRCTPA